MDILSYLTDLLDKQNEVGIEGLGTFFKQKLPGRYDTENHLFVPPTYFLNFKPEINEGTSFSSYLSSANNISTESAQHHIGLFIEDINRQLAVSNEADLDSIGKLSYVDDILTLKEQGSINLGSEFYGLPTISPENLDESVNTADVNSTSVIDEINLNDDQEIFDEITETRSITIPERKIEIETPESNIEEESEQQNFLPSFDQIQTQEPQKKVEPSEAATANIWHFDKERATALGNTVSDQPLEDTKTGTSGWIKGLIVIIILAIIGAGLYILKPKWFGLDRVPVVQNELNDTVATVAQPVMIDTLTNTDSTSTSNGIDTVSKVPPVVNSNRDSTTWEIIGASLTKGEVKKYVKDMKAIGYIAKPMPTMPGKKRIKMSIATFNSEESAVEGRKILVQKLKNKDLYIFQNKNTQKPL